MQPNLSVKIGKLKLKNPLLVASGTFGYAQEFRGLVDLRQIGAVITKTITLRPKEGNLPPRTAEAASGLLNSIGLENPGIEVFLKEKMPFLKKTKTPIIVSIMGESINEFKELTKILDKIQGVNGIELNLSCPNIRSQVSGRKLQIRNLKPKTWDMRRLIAQDPKATYEVVEAVRQDTNKTLIAKLSPNVTDITQIAKAAITAGADALSAINTFFAMAIDIKTGTSKLGSITGGLSGPAIKPQALYLVWELARKFKVPIIASGGIMTVSDAVEFLIAGATAVSIGTANFVNPKAGLEIIKGIKDYLIRNKISNIKTLIGTIET